MAQGYGEQRGFSEFIVLHPCHSSSCSYPALLWVLPAGCSSLKTAPALVFSMGYSPSGMDITSMNPPQYYKSCQKTCSSMVSFSWGHRSFQKPAQVWALQGGTASFGHIHQLWPSWAKGWISAPLQTSAWAAGGQPASP